MRSLSVMLLAPYPSTIVFFDTYEVVDYMFIPLTPFEFVINLGCFNLNYWPNNLHFSLMLSHALSVPVGHQFAFPYALYTFNTANTFIYMIHLIQDWIHKASIFLVLIDSCCIIPYCFGHYYYNIYIHPPHRDWSWVIDLIFIK